MSTTLSKHFFVGATIQDLLARHALIAQAHMEATLMISGDTKTHTSIMWMLKVNHLLKEGHYMMRRLMPLKAANLMTRCHMPAKVPNIMKKAMVKIMMNTYLSKNAHANDNSKPKLKHAKKWSISMNKSVNGKQTWI